VVDPFWAIGPPQRSVATEARAARDAGRLAIWIAGLSPSDPRYRALQAMRCRYRSIVDAGGWAVVPASASGRKAPPPAASALQARLAAEGYLQAAEARLGAGDAALKTAVTDFQTHHALTPDGAVGARTLAALNISAEARLAQIDANLERWRWLPRLPPDRLEVDVGGAQATLYADDAPRLAMRAIVGDPRHKTPLFASRLESTVFNPPWNVPASIAQNELLPHERANPGYLARNDFMFVDGALQQRPGPLNALGQLKFDFPSPFGVYLHDTPARAAFGQANRWRSHGCVRLEDPQGLAAAVLGPQGWTPDKIAAAVAAGATSRVALAKPVPLYVTYWTVVIASDGASLFRPDTYGWDAKLLRALSVGAGSSGKSAQVDGGCSTATAGQPLL
jgi:murein L,D-transpeptidase YcbB/YkuD